MLLEDGNNTLKGVVEADAGSFTDSSSDMIPGRLLVKLQKMLDTALTLNARPVQLKDCSGLAPEG
jgi:hypothetical protein